MECPLSEVQLYCWTDLVCSQCSPKTTKINVHVDCVCVCVALPVILQADLSPADLADFEKSNAG